MKQVQIGRLYKMDSKFFVDKMVYLYTIGYTTNYEGKELVRTIQVVDDRKNLIINVYPSTLTERYHLVEDD